MSAPLPPGWEAKYDPNSQRYFYINHATKATQWAPPQPAFQQYQQPAASYQQQSAYTPHFMQHTPQGGYSAQAQRELQPTQPTSSSPGGYAMQQHVSSSDAYKDVHENEIGETNLDDLEEDDDDSEFVSEADKQRMLRNIKNELDLEGVADRVITETMKACIYNQEMSISMLQGMGFGKKGESAGPSKSNRMAELEEEEQKAKEQRKKRREEREKQQKKAEEHERKKKEKREKEKEKEKKEMEKKEKERKENSKKKSKTTLKDLEKELSNLEVSYKDIDTFFKDDSASTLFNKTSSGSMFNKVMGAPKQSRPPVAQITSSSLPVGTTYELQAKLPARGHNPALISRARTKAQGTDRMLARGSSRTLAQGASRNLAKGPQKHQRKQKIAQGASRSLYMGNNSQLAQGPRAS